MATVKVKVLGLHGSPFAGGNSDILLEKALSAATEAGAVTEKVSLFGKKITPCNYCQSCHRNGGKCAVSDDMQAIYQKIIEADVIIHVCFSHFLLFFINLFNSIHHPNANQIECSHLVLGHARSSQMCSGSLDEFLHSRLGAAPGFARSHAQEGHGSSGSGS